MVYYVMVKIKWTDKISNEEVLQRIREKEVCLYNSVQKQKMAFAGHVLRGSSGKDLFDVLEGKLNSNLPLKLRPYGAIQICLLLLLLLLRKTQQDVVGWHQKLD